MMMNLLKYRRMRRSTDDIGPRTVLRPSPDVLTAHGDGVAVLLDFRSEQFLGLDDAGSVIWSALEGGASLERVVDSLVDAFDAERSDLEGDARRFIDELLTRRLVVAT